MCKYPTCPPCSRPRARGCRCRMRHAPKPACPRGPCADLGRAPPCMSGGCVQSQWPCAAAAAERKVCATRLLTPPTGAPTLACRALRYLEEKKRDPVMCQALRLQVCSACPVLCSAPPEALA